MHYENDFSIQDININPKSKIPILTIGINQVEDFLYSGYRDFKYRSLLQKAIDQQAESQQQQERIL